MEGIMEHFLKEGEVSLSLSETQLSGFYNFLLCTRIWTHVVRRSEPSGNIFASGVRDIDLRVTSLCV
jgi:hypothetical protein